MFRNNQDTLEKLLQSVFGHFDEYCFLDTGSTDDSRRMVNSFCKQSKQPASVQKFEWCDDFAKARQANFEMARGRWRMFLDSDDILIGGEKIRGLIDKCEKTRPEVNGIFLRYDYDVLEELDQMRLAKWTDGWKWSDAIHERMVNETGMVFGSFNAKDVIVWHRRKTPDDKREALARNSRIAKREYEATYDLEYRARLARTIAMEIKMESDGKVPTAAIPLLEQVVSVYPTLPEGRQAAADLSRIHAATGDLDAALKWAKKAGPSYEAIVLHAQNRLEESIAAQTRAQGPQTTHEGFIFEQVFAPVCMADAAYQLGQVPERLERVINKIRADLRVNPNIRPAVDRIRHAIDRITILIPGTPQPFDASSTGSMLGGSEEAVVYLSKALSKLGRNVRVFGVLPPLTVPGVDQFGIDWQPFDKFRIHDEHGTLVVWRSTDLLHQIAATSTDLNRRAQAGDEKAIPPTGIGASGLWLHDMSLGWQGNSAGLLAAVDSVVVLSDHHRKCIERELPPDHQVPFVKLSNGIVREDFERLDWSKRDPNRVVYSSCPSRGLVHLLEEWPRIKAACPKAYLDIYYDWSMLEKFQPEVHARCVAALESVAGLDVKHHGGVGHAVLHEALAGANVWAYSHFDSTDVETFCVSAIKATAAGAEVITARNGALPEVVPEATFSERQSYADEVIDAILNPMSESERRGKAQRVMDRFDWARVAEQFSQVWTVRDPVPTVPECTESAPTSFTKVPASKRSASSSTTSNES